MGRDSCEGGGDDRFSAREGRDAGCIAFDRILMGLQAVARARRSAIAAQIGPEAGGRSMAMSEGDSASASRSAA